MIPRRPDGGDITTTNASTWTPGRIRVVGIAGSAVCGVSAAGIAALGLLGFGPIWQQGSPLVAVAYAVPYLAMAVLSSALWTRYGTDLGLGGRAAVATLGVALVVAAVSILVVAFAPPAFANPTYDFFGLPGLRFGVTVLVVHFLATFVGGVLWAETDAHRAAAGLLAATVPALILVTGVNVAAGPVPLVPYEVVPVLGFAALGYDFWQDPGSRSAIEPL